MERYDRTFIERLQLGDDLAWREFLEWARGVCDAAARKLGFREEAREACVAFIQAELFVRIRKFDPNGKIPFEGFVIVVARTLAVEYGREVLGWRRAPGKRVCYRPPEAIPDRVDPAEGATSERDHVRELVLRGLQHGSALERLAFKLKFGGLALALDAGDLQELERRTGRSAAEVLADIERIEVEDDGRRRSKPVATLLGMSPCALDKAASRMKLAIEGRTREGRE